MRWIISLSLLCVMASSTVHARQICTTHANMNKALRVEHAEAAILRGINWDGSLIKVWINAKSSNFSITQSYTNGLSCMVLNGKNLDTIVWTLEPKQGGPEL